MTQRKSPSKETLQLLKENNDFLDAVRLVNNIPTRDDWQAIPVAERLVMMAEYEKIVKQ